MAYLSVVVWRLLSALLTSYSAYLVCEYSATMKRYSRAVAAHSANQCTIRPLAKPRKPTTLHHRAVVETVENYTGQICTKQQRLQFLISQALPGISGGEICYLKELCH